ncbi:hypothetical protein B0H14DRAFT_2719790 [Mycena olivaceomarginata]|nr:hypothetical protein B0H14DRAFT_2719790 [Mycena olivaceomarginata]
MPDDEVSGAHVRIATLNEIDGMMQRAFLSSPVQAYFSNAKAPLTTHTKDMKWSAHQTRYIQFLIHRSLSLGGRLRVVYIPVHSTENHPARIAGAAIWCPPRCKKPPSLLASLRMGLLSVIMGWSIGVIAHILDFTHLIEHTLDQGYAERKLLGTPEDWSWYLQLTGVDLEFQGKGGNQSILKFAYLPF